MWGGKKYKDSYWTMSISGFQRAWTDWSTW